MGRLWASKDEIGKQEKQRRANEPIGAETEDHTFVPKIARSASKAHI